MAKVVALNATSPTEEQRQRFEAWAKGGMTGPREASTLLARSRGGDYVLGTTRAAWAAWQAAIYDLIANTKKRKRRSGKDEPFRPLYRQQPGRRYRDPRGFD